MQVAATSDGVVVHDYERNAARIFDEMDEDYDDIRSVWYSWHFARLHHLLARTVLPQCPAGAFRVLDMGCGTGFQSFLYAAAGGAVQGIDLSAALVARARAKAAVWDPTAPLFPGHFAFVDRYHALTMAAVAARHPETVVPPTFAVGSVLAAPCADASVDVVNCCGSVLSFVDDYAACLREIHRVLKPGGLFVLDVEGKYNFDMLWRVIDAATGGHLGYHATLREALHLWRTKPAAPVHTRYPFGDPEHPVMMDLTRFARRGLEADLREAGLVPQSHHWINGLTNLLPGTMLDTNTPGPLLTQTFLVLRWIEERFSSAVPGSSLVIIGRKAA